MRDPNRIPHILDEIEQLWQIYPDQRLGQLLQNYVFGRGDIFFQEDTETLVALHNAMLQANEIRTNRHP